MHVQAYQLVKEADVKAARAELHLPEAEKAAQHAETARSAFTQVCVWTFFEKRGRWGKVAAQQQRVAQTSYAARDVQFCRPAPVCWVNRGCLPLLGAPPLPARQARRDAQLLAQRSQQLTVDAEKKMAVRCKSAGFAGL